MYVQSVCNPTTGPCGLSIFELKAEGWIEIQPNLTSIMESDDPSEDNAHWDARYAFLHLKQF